jgi:hypothetical protein
MPEIEIRQAWISGSYKNAIERDVLEEALNIQDILLGPMVSYGSRDSSTPLVASAADAPQHHQDSERGSSSFQMLFHSPLMYWNCSSLAIEADCDVIETVNRQSRMQSPFNVTLRHSSVFGGKSFEEKRLVAADALVISLLYQRGSKAGDIWMRGAQSVADTGKYDVYPREGSNMSSTLYEFRYQPATYASLLPLALVSVLTATYVLWGVVKLKSLNGRLSIAVAAVTQVWILSRTFSASELFTVVADLCLHPYGICGYGLFQHTTVTHTSRSLFFCRLCDWI